MLYEFHQGHSATAASNNISGVYGDVVSVRVCQQWFRRFRKGDTDLCDRKRGGRPSVVDQSTLEGLVDEDPTLTTHELAALLGCNQSTVVRHLHSIGKSCRAGVWVPHLLSEKNVADRVSICQELLTRNEQELILKGSGLEMKNGFSTRT